MKTTFSKRFLSALLAMLMIITSIPLGAIAAFAAEVDTDADDQYVAAAKAKMQEFENLLNTPNKSYANVGPAYAAFVDCQEAIDAYQFGDLTSAVVTDATNILDRTINGGSYNGVTYAGISEFSPKEANAVPTFPTHSTYNEMTEYHGRGYNNVLFAKDAIEQTSGRAGGVDQKTYYSPDAVLMYDGINQAQLPILVSANCINDSSGYNKTRYIWSAYPSDASGNDNDTFKLNQVWSSGNGTNADWDWNWWAANWGGYTHTAGYNKATGFKGVYSNSMRVGPIAKGTRRGTFSYTYYAGDPSYMSNYITFVAEPTSYGMSYTDLYWYISTGGDKNDDVTCVKSSSAIGIVNYKKILDSLETNGSKMKGVDLDDFSYGGLQAYINAMDNLASFDPNSYAGQSTFDLDGCNSEMQRRCVAANNASVNNTNADVYDALRNAMTAAVGDYGDGTNPGFTGGTWGPFKTAYEAAKSVMASLTTTGYASASDPTKIQGVQDIVDNLTSTWSALVRNVAPVDTTALEAVISAFESYKSIFTTATTNAALSAIEAAKIAVWGSVENYPSTIYTIDATPENQIIYNNALAAVQAAITALRISPDGVVQTTYGKFSMNMALDLEDNVRANADDYGNWGSFVTALNNGRNYIATLDVDLTDYDAQYAAYQAAVQAVITAYDNLAFSFTKLPDGTLANTGAMASMDPGIQVNDQGFQSLDFDYTSSATIIKTNHNPVTDLTFGYADITFGCNVNNTGCGNNFLDAITINATKDMTGNTGEKISDDKTNAAGQQPGTPNFPSDYAITNGNEAGQFALKNIHVLNKSSNNKTTRPAKLDDGTEVTDMLALSQMDLTSVLSNTSGSTGNPPSGGVFVHSNNNDCAYMYMTSDFTIDIPGTTSKYGNLTANDYPTATTYNHSGYIGAVALKNCTKVINYSYWAYYKSSNAINVNVSVVDISNLVDLVNECKAMIKDVDMYDSDLWSAFITALENAQKEYNYKGIPANTIASNMKTRFTNLLAAKNALQYKESTVKFIYKDANGADVESYVGAINDTSKVYKYAADGVTKLPTMTYASTLASKAAYSEAYNNLPLVNYSDDLNDYEFIGWDPAFDENTEIKADAVFTAQYAVTERIADFDAYNQARSALKTALAQNDKYTVASLNAVAADLTGLSFYNTVAPEDATGSEPASLLQTSYKSSSNASITAEKDILVAALAKLVPVTYDKTVAEALSDELEYQKKTDPDMYDGDVSFEYQQSVNVAGIDVVGLIYTSQEALNEAIRNTVNGINITEYHVYVTVNGQQRDLGAYPYGTSIIISSDVTDSSKPLSDVLFTNVNDIDADVHDGSKWLGWSYHYESATAQSVDKYMFSAKSFGFVVRGDAYITADAPQGDTTHAVTIKNESGKVIYTDLSNGDEYTLPTAPARAFYAFKDYTVKGETKNAGETIAVTGDITIVANYTPEAESTYWFSLFESGEAFADDMEPFDEFSASYNELVEFSVPDAYCICSAYMDPEDYTVQYTVIAYGDTYNFYACQSYYLDIDEEDYRGLVALTEDEYQALQVTEDIDPYNYSEHSLYDCNGDRIVAGGTYGDIQYVGQIQGVTALDHAVPIKVNSVATKFSLIGTYTLADGVKIKETGFLFTSDSTAKVADMTVENVGTKGIARMKASRQTVGNQFVVNITNPSSSVNFKYVSYIVVEYKDASNNTVTEYIYSGLQNGSNNF